jgi:hypothetical protein
MTDKPLCVCAPPHKYCLAHFSALSPAERQRVMLRMGISRSAHNTAHRSRKEQRR